MPSYSYQLHSWMRDLNAIIGDIRLTQLKIPATHNSGAFSVDFFKRVKCQYHSIGEQLNHGIRYFDIRLKESFDLFDSDEGCYSLYMHHNGVTNEVQRFSEALKQLSNFLCHNPREFVVINITHETGSVDLLHNLIGKHLAPYIFLNTPEHSEMLHTDRFTLNQVVRREGGTTNQVMIFGSGNVVNRMIQEKNLPSRFYWAPSPGNMGIWNEHIYRRNGNYQQQLKDLQAYLIREISRRETAKHLFFCSDTYLYNQANSIHEMGHYSQDVFRNVIRGASQSLINNINVVPMDFAHGHPSRDIIDLNLENVVTIYADNNYQGDSLRLVQRNYTYPELNEAGFNDRISSIRVKSGYRVVMYEHDNFCGESKVFRNDTSMLNDFNDRVSSLSVEKDDEIVASVMEYEDFKGRGWNMSCGSYLQTILMERGMHDEISSVRVKPGYRVILFEDYAFTGKETVYTSDCGRLGGADNKASCMVVERDEEVVATVYDQIHCNGRSWKLSCGRYSTQDMVDRWFEKCIKSLRVKSGYRVILYKGKDFTGENYAYALDSLTVGSYTDNVLSIIVEKI